MRISEYAKNYTDGRGANLGHVWSEIKEVLVEVGAANWPGIKEELEDTFHFVQLWLWCRFGLDGEIWRITRHSVDKFVARKEVWNELYAAVGLPSNISGYVGNYHNLTKVIKHLERFGVSPAQAEAAYKKVVQDQTR